MPFEVVSKYKPSGDQPKAIRALTEGIEKGDKLSKEQVKRINAQFEADTLYKVEAIDWDTVDTSSFPEG